MSVHHDSVAAPRFVRSFEEIRSVADLRRLRRELLTLWRADQAATVFQSPHWLFAWLEHINSDERLSAILVRSGDLVVGFAPFYLHSTREGVRELSLMGSGISDYLDIICLPGYRSQVGDAVFEYLLACGDWDVVKFEEVAAGSLLLRRPVPFDNLVEAQSVCPVLRLSPSLDFAHTIPAPAFRKVSYYRRRLARSMRVDVKTADESNVQALLNSCIELHGGRWAARGQSGVLSDSRIAAFHHSVAKALAADGMLRMYVLQLGGRDAAAFYGFHKGGRTMYYLGGFAPEFARLNPGTVVVGRAIEMAIAEGAEEFDFLRGSEPYKFFWGASPRLNYRRVIYRNREIWRALNHAADSRS